MPRSRWYTDADPIADEQRRAEARQLLGIESDEELPPQPQLAAGPAGAVLVCVDAVEGAAAGAPCVEFWPM